MKSLLANEQIGGDKKKLLRTVEQIKYQKDPLPSPASSESDNRPEFSQSTIDSSSQRFLDVEDLLDAKEEVIFYEKEFQTSKSKFQDMSAKKSEERGWSIVISTYLHKKIHNDEILFYDSLVYMGLVAKVLCRRWHLKKWEPFNTIIKINVWSDMSLDPN